MAQSRPLVLAAAKWAAVEAGTRLGLDCLRNVGDRQEKLMDYTGTQSEKAVAARELDRSHIGHTISFQPNDFTVVFGRIAGIARTEAMVYLSLDGVSGGTHLKDEYDLPLDHEVFLQVDVISNAETTIKDLFGKVQENLRGGTTKGQERTDKL